eukprot:1968678-Alexandrium_andersonii.AAC.1
MPLHKHAPAHAHAARAPTRPRSWPMHERASAHHRMRFQFRAACAVVGGFGGWYSVVGLASRFARG